MHHKEPLRKTLRSSVKPLRSFAI